MVGFKDAFAPSLRLLFYAYYYYIRPRRFVWRAHYNKHLTKILDGGEDAKLHSLPEFVRTVSLPFCWFNSPQQTFIMET